MEKESAVYDVAIVGAGPAGSAAAISCRRQGLSSVLIDKAAFPRDKLCGDGIPLKTFNLLQELGFEEKHLFLKGYKISRLKVWSPDCKLVEYGDVKPDASTKSGCIPRYFFDHMLYQKAAEQANKVLDNHKLEKLEQKNGYYSLTLKSLRHNKTAEINARFVLGADGANSFVARTAGMLPRDQQHHFDGLRWYYGGKKFDSSVHLFYDKRALPGYVWVFPVAEDKANVGIMTDKRHKRDGKTIRDLFLEILENNPRLKELLDGAQPLDNIKGAPLPLGTLPGSRIKDGILLIGDAAAFINPVTGGGIYFAVASGIKAAEFCASAIDDNGGANYKALLPYEAWWRKEILPGFEYSGWLKKRFESLMFTRFFLNAASRLKPFANFFIMVYGRPLPKHAFRHPFFWLKVMLTR